MEKKLVFEIDDFDRDLVFGAADPEDEDNYLTAGADGKDDEAKP